MTYDRIREEEIKKREKEIEVKPQPKIED